MFSWCVQLVRVNTIIKLCWFIYSEVKESIFFLNAHVLFFVFQRTCRKLCTVFFHPKSNNVHVVLKIKQIKRFLSVTIHACRACRFYTFGTCIVLDDSILLLISIWILSRLSKQTAESTFRLLAFMACTDKQTSHHCEVTLTFPVVWWRFHSH